MLVLVDQLSESLFDSPLVLDGRCCHQRAVAWKRPFEGSMVRSQADLQQDQLLQACVGRSRRSPRSAVRTSFPRAWADCCGRCRRCRSSSVAVVPDASARWRGPRPGQVRPRTSCSLGAWRYRFDEKAGSGSRIGGCSRIGPGAGAVAFADLGAGDSLVIEARRRSRSSGANSIFLRMPSTSRITAACSGVGSRCNRRQPSSSPSCVTSQNDSRSFVAVQ